MLRELITFLKYPIGWLKDSNVHDVSIRSIAVVLNRCVNSYVSHNYVNLTLVVSFKI